MKNVLVVISLVTLMCGFNSCKSMGSMNYPEPVFGNPSAKVIDTFKEKGVIKDYVKVHNGSRDSDMNFNVYMHQPSTNDWILYGTASLKGTGDTDTITFEGIDMYRYFAIESLNGKNYKYQIYKSSNDLHINVLDY